MYQEFLPPKRSWLTRTVGGQWLGFRRLARAFRDNARVLLLTDLLWAFPCAWAFYYVPRYAQELGVSPQKWGYLVALSRLLQLLYAPVGGILADRWGRKRTLILIDTLAWTTPFVIYYFSRNQFHLFAALAFNSLWIVGVAAWECLFIESVPRRHLARIVSIRSVFFLLPGITTFIAGFIVRWKGVYEGTRLMFLMALCMIIPGIILRIIFIRETSPERSEPGDTGTVSFREALRALRRDRRLSATVALRVITYWASMGFTNFLVLFLTTRKGGLALPDDLSAVVPAVRYAMLTVWPVVVMLNIKERNAPRFAAIGTAVWLAGIALYTVVPAGNLLLAALVMVLVGTGSGIAQSGITAVFGLVVPPRLRARITSITWMLGVGGISLIMAGGGWVFEAISPRAFVGIISAIVLTALILALIANGKRPAPSSREASASAPLYPRNGCQH